MLASTSNGTNLRNAPPSRSASSNTRVFSEVPLPNSTNVSAPVTDAISAARDRRISASARVG
jgi:hypothetical protein